MVLRGEKERNLERKKVKGRERMSQEEGERKEGRERAAEDGGLPECPPESMVAQ